MRVIGGRLRSRLLKSVPGNAVRPTPDRLREALFNVLAPRIEGAVFLDAYAGTGAVGVEAISRGASRVIFIESNRRAITVLRENLAALDVVAEHATIVQGKAAAQVARYTCDIAFLDPPYEAVDDYTATLRALGTAACPLVIAQHASRFALDERYAALKKTRVLKQGDNSLTFFERDSTGE